MTKKQKIYLGGALIVVGILLAVALNTSGEEKNSDTPPPPPNDDGTFNPNADSLGSGEPQTVEEQNQTGNENEITVGDFITPYGEYTRVRETMSIDDGFNDNWYEEGDLDYWGMGDDGKVYAGEIIGQVTNITDLGTERWYTVNVCAIANGISDTLSNVQQEMAQDNCDAPYGFVIQSVSINDSLQMPNVRKV
tara:strand:- start:120 stop:698 length:579 start_codon:yes stop_codon:yes gene_type:complete